jgi:hypothetical protein
MTPHGKNALVSTANNAPVLYDRMREAISACYAVDDCKKIASQAHAFAAYYKQIKDDETVRKFLQVKLRAWRRIGEILMSANIDKSKCFHEGSSDLNYAEFIRQTRAAFKHNKDISELSDSDFRQALKLVEMPEDFFEKNIDNHGSVTSLLTGYAAAQHRAWLETSAGKKWQKQNDRLKEEASIEAANRERKRQEDEAAARTMNIDDIAKLKAAQTEAFNEVGITLSRRDREEMRQIVFLLKKELHEVLRQAAFDNRVTMQSILRSGLMMWLMAHGYIISTDDMQVVRREGPRPGQAR